MILKLNVPNKTLKNMKDQNQNFKTKCTKMKTAKI